MDDAMTGKCWWYRIHTMSTKSGWRYREVRKYMILSWDLKKEDELGAQRGEKFHFIQGF